MALTAMWTHGNAVIPETPELLNECKRFGFGTQVKLKRNTKQWFHVPMPTPVFLGGARQKLKRIFILSNSTAGNECITRVHIFDNNNLIADRGVFICGNRLTISSSNTILMDHTINFGLSVTMFIDAVFDVTFFFAGFGADWE
ncbi:DUF6623 family protein [Nonomuraea dietziae]|uniref:Uncharacterized protein n=1 Tax=Nonomuraea dietziae TaxID=65515 RepID=A0A7W5Y8E8_9ACTN|nr:DUF6623 family protein [Nonomuraea dietziae]MBB3724448.1 hypothetical protein [Nonomuraea dietziae]